MSYTVSDGFDKTLRSIMLNILLHSIKKLQKLFSSPYKKLSKRI